MYIFLYLERVNVSFLEQCSVEKSVVHFNAQIYNIEYFSDFSSGYNQLDAKSYARLTGCVTTQTLYPGFLITSIFLVFVTSTSINSTKTHQ